MSTEENKAIVQKIFSDPDFMEYFAEDIVWTIQGFRSFHGKQEIIQELITPLMNLMESMGRVVITNIIAEDDQVALEAIAEDRTTKKGKPYNNTYCIIYRFADGEIAQITEYSDTAMARDALPELGSK